MTEGGLALPTLFNVAVDSVVRHWMSLTVEGKYATYELLGMAVGWYMGMFYAYEGITGYRDP